MHASRFRRSTLGILLFLLRYLRIFVLNITILIYHDLVRSLKLIGYYLSTTFATLTMDILIYMQDFVCN